MKSARAALVAQGKRLVLQEWDLFRQVTENYNGIVGVGEDVQNADPFYRESQLISSLFSRARAPAPYLFLSPPPPPSFYPPYADWGALPGFLSFLESGAY